MPPALADREDADRVYFQSKILSECLQFQLHSSLLQAIPLTPEQSAIHQTYLTYIEPMIGYDFLDTAVAYKRSPSRKPDRAYDFRLLQEKLYSEALGKTRIMRNVVQTWIDDQQLKKSLQQLQEHISAVCTYDLCRHWGNTQPEDKEFMEGFYDDWLDELADEDADRSRQIALCIVVLLSQSYFCDVSRYPNLQVGIKDIVTCRHIMKPVPQPGPGPVVDLT